MRSDKSLIDVKSLDDHGIVELSLEQVINLKKPKVVVRGFFVDLDEVLDHSFDFRAELISVGGKMYSQSKHTKPRYKPIVKKRDGIDDIYSRVLPEINRFSFRVIGQEEYYQKESSRFHLDHQGATPMISDDITDTSGSVKLNLAQTTLNLISYRTKRLLALFLVVLVGFGILVIRLKHSIIQSGSSAVINLEQAKTNLGGFELGKALTNFSNAYSEFSKAGDSVNFMGGYLGGLIAEIPGNSQYKSARNLIEAGKLFSKAGESIASVLSAVSKAGVLLDPNHSGASLVMDIKRTILFSQANIQKASKLLTDIDPSIIPEDKRRAFTEFQDKLPQILKLSDQGADYVRFLENLIAISGSKKYLILFQNPSELRPTGGFPGSYGILSFKNGKLEEFKVDDVYNIDGQIKENIIPPKQLQHITPTWGMRDANWFIDFPMSARKIMQFFKKEAGYDVDGVITFSPTIVGKILEVTGPISLPEYNLTLDSNNFIDKIQSEVEYGQNRIQPKSILIAFAPKLLEKIYLAEHSEWLKIFDILIASPENKDMLMYFRDFSLQSFVLERGFGGDVKSITDGGDYLMTTFSNIKGSKTDAVIDNSVKLYVSRENGLVRHQLLVTRKHNGGSSKYGFYNRVNPTYIMILVPDDAMLVKIAGNDKTSFKPLISYGSSDFVKDEDLFKLEASFDEGDKGLTKYEESGKKGFGFWLMLNPGETRTVELDYDTPVNKTGAYELYLQKQPGLRLNDFELVLKNSSDIRVSSEKDVLMSVLGNTNVVNYIPAKDMIVGATLK